MIGIGPIAVPFCGDCGHDDLPLRRTEKLKELAAARAARAGVSFNQNIAALLPAHVCAQGETERYFADSATPGTAPDVLARTGRRRLPRAEDRLDAA
jgi:hypothetical protein